MDSQAAENKLYRWLDSRLSLTPLIEWSRHKTVPVHKEAFWYYMGGIVMIFLVTQFLSGILLMVYYVPDLKSAHSSILNLNTQVNFGWFIRSVHSWGANLLILGLYFHFFSTLLMKSYRPPREFTWWTGLAMMGILFTFGFSGYLLPWDQTSFFASKVGIDIANNIPFIGPFMAGLLRGGAAISQDTLSRFFTLHVIVLPLCLLPLFGLHLLLIQVHGTSSPAWFKRLPEDKRQYEKFFPEFLLKDFMGWLIVLNILAILVTLFPWGLGPQAQPFQPAPPGIKPEWYFLFLFQFFRLLPAKIGPVPGEQFGILLFGLVVLSLFVLPFWDTGQSALRSKVATGYGWLLLGLFAVLTVMGYLL
jgi:quinol-cytochrome oxidoreductase complex cytochrome b subunit